MMEAVRTSETSVDNHFIRQYIPEDNSEHQRRGLFWTVNSEEYHDESSRDTGKFTNNDTISVLTNFVSLKVWWVRPKRGCLLTLAYYAFPR
jgi:hypothetical protein